MGEAASEGQTGFFGTVTGWMTGASKEKKEEPRKMVVVKERVSEEGWYLADPGDQWLQVEAKGRKAFNSYLGQCLPKEKGGMGWVKWRDTLEPSFDSENWFASTNHTAAHKRKAPHHWTRISDLCSGVQVFPTPSHDRPQTHLGRVYQGALTNMYMIEALQVIAMRPSLARSMFIASDPQKGLYVVRLYVNGGWTFVAVDDLIPMDPFDRPLCATSQYFPYCSFASILEKAYAKLHMSWDTISEGGYTEEALVDFTGGLVGRFHLRNVACDRLFVYLMEMQRECMWVARTHMQSCQMRGINLGTTYPYVIHRVVQFEGQCYVQLLYGGPAAEDGGLQDSVPYNLIYGYPEKMGDGAVWMVMEDFHQYFDTVIECRLLNSDPACLFIHGMPPSRHEDTVVAPWKSKGNTGWCEYLWAYDAEQEGGAQALDPSRAPNFLITVYNTPCEVTCCLAQANLRREEGFAAWNDNRDPERDPYPAVQLNVMQRKEGHVDEYVFVTSSNWMPCREATVSFRVGVHASKYMIHAVIDDSGVSAISKAIFRVYSTVAVEVLPTRPGVKPQWSPPDGPLAGMPLDFFQAGDTGEPTVWDEDEGKGVGNSTWEVDPSEGRVVICNVKAVEGNAIVTTQMLCQIQTGSLVKFTQGSMFDKDGSKVPGPAIRGLEDGESYYARALDDDRFSLHPTLDDAEGDGEPIAISGGGKSNRFIWNEDPDGEGIIRCYALDPRDGKQFLGQPGKTTTEGDGCSVM
uniref:Calpain catalytic domain-containing protein n=1 Tax=Oxyrrhis marina TaxID=2969 RepID=A0A7S4LQH2_OXYMA|mmetsp:Transcript_36737/g.88301  ORF Transcript_36737/g.88301 Transcript_36737/m.88301 type:complete len:745 (+) Transcript_36737:59-2293(+)